MTDKNIKDSCKNCDVEPPAMRFKCPECEHNPDKENNFAKDINVPRKEQIIIDGVNIIGTIDEWARLVAHEWGTDEYSDAEIVKNYILDINKQLARKTQELEVICKAFDIEYAYDDDGKIYGKSNKLRSLEQENEALKEKRETSEKWRIKAESSNEKLDLKNTRYSKALEEIEKYCSNAQDPCQDNWTREKENFAKIILDIIRREKGEE